MYSSPPNEITTRFRSCDPIRMVKTIEVTLAVSRTTGLSTPAENRTQHE